MVLSSEDFQFSHLLGKGSNAIVYQVRSKTRSAVRNRDTSLRASGRGHVQQSQGSNATRVFALKMLEKESHADKEYFAFRERHILLKLKHQPNIVNLYWTFSDSIYLYFVLELCPRGELAQLISVNKTLPFELARFYAGELVNILNVLRKFEVAHRDLKPENILISKDRHLVLVDFGLSMYKDCKDGQGGMMVGTTNYVAPEMIKYHEKCDDFPIAYSLDLWAAACIIYQMFDGNPPFSAHSEFYTLRRILKAEESLTFSETFDPLAKDLCSKILRKDMNKRLGQDSLDDVRNHEFFPKWEWAKLPKMKVPRPENLKDPKNVPKLLALSSWKHKKDDCEGRSRTPDIGDQQPRISEFKQRPSIASSSSRHDPEERYLRHKTLSLRKIDVIDDDESVLRCEKCVMRRIPCMQMKYLVITDKNRLLVMCPFFQKLLHDFATFWVEKLAPRYVVIRGGPDGRLLRVKDGDGSWSRVTRLPLNRRSTRDLKTAEKKNTQINTKTTKTIDKKSSACKSEDVISQKL